MKYSEMSLDELKEEVMANVNFSKDVALMRECHTRLWDWLYKNPECHKEQWPGWDYKEPGYFGGQHIFGCCFMCAAHTDCSICPLFDDALPCAMYFKWSTSKSTKIRQRLANCIRDSWNATEEGTEAPNEK